MNKHLPLAALLLASSAAASAQSSVTLFGIVDLGLRHVSNEGVGALNSMASGGSATSRFGLRASEDLGGGLSAGFHLESGIAADTGASTTANQFFDRRATVSLVSKTLGELRAGRDFVPSYSNWSRFDPFSYVGVAGANLLLTATPAGPINAAFGSNPNTTVRSSNALQVLLPGNLGGLEGGVMIAAGEGGTAENGQHRVIGARLGYAAGPAVLSAATTVTRNMLTGSENFRDSAVGGSWDFGAVKVSAAWRRFQFVDAKQTNLLLAAVVPLGAGQVKLSVNKADLDGSVGAVDIGANGATQLGLGYVHELSKRSALYTTASRISNRGASKYTVPGGASGMAGGGRSTGLEFGVRHTF